MLRPTSSASLAKLGERGGRLATCSAGEHSEGVPKLEVLEGSTGDLDVARFRGEVYIELGCCLLQDRPCRAFSHLAVVRHHHTRKYT